jgi:hypothetical protein
MHDPRPARSGVINPEGSSVSTSAAVPLRSPHAAFDDFLGREKAMEMRRHAEAHFASPEKHQAATHQVWNYWHVPRLYNYLRTNPEKVIPHELVQNFHLRLTEWARRRLGLGHVSWPFLSLYINGCSQGLHNDSTNGRFGYVYSLTPNSRRGSGGETIVLKEGDLFRSKLTQGDAGRGLYDLISPVFDRLAIFDDRMPHGVERIEGTMDPMDGRLVLHGHISESGVMVDGPLSAQQFQTAALPAVQKVLAAAGPAMKLYHGPLVIRLAIEPSGRVQSHQILLDRVARPDGADCAQMVEALVAAVAGSRYPEADLPSEATMPLLIGGLLPWMPRRAKEAARTS